MEPLTVSVAMGTYNGAAHILEQLESLSRQSYRIHELVITDDGSTDNTLAIAEAFGQTSPFPVRIVPNGRQLGFSDNFLKAASLCTGDLISFCDQDDVWSERKIETCVSFFRDPKTLLAIHSARLWDGKVQEERLFPSFPETRVFNAGELNPFAFIPGFALVFRRCVLEFTDNTNRPKRRHHHDEWVWMLATSAGRVATIAEPLALYRQHSANTVGAPARRKPGGLFGKLRRAAKAADFAELASREAQCAAVLNSILKEKGDLAFAAQIRSTANKFTFLSATHELRARLYAKPAKLRNKIAAYLRLLRSGGYSAGWGAMRAGWRAAFKDLVFGVGRF